MTQLPPSTIEDKLLAKAGLLTAARGWTELCYSTKGIEYWRRGNHLFLPPDEEGGEWRELLSPHRPPPPGEEEDEWQELPLPSPPKREHTSPPQSQLKRRLRKLVSPETVTPTTPLRLDVAAQLAFPDGSIGVSGLRREIARGTLRAERIAGKIFVTLAAIQDMRTRCAMQKGPDSTCESHEGRVDDGDGSSSIPAPTEADSKSAQAHLQTIVEKLKKPSPTISQKSTFQTSAKVVPIKS